MGLGHGRKMTCYFPDRWVGLDKSCILSTNIGSHTLSHLQSLSGKDLLEALFHSVLSIGVRVNPISMFYIGRVQVSHLNIRPEWGRDFKTRKGEFPAFNIEIEILLPLHVIKPSSRIERDGVQSELA